MIDSWVDNSNQLKCLKINPREKLIIHSSVGEWHLNAMFNNKEDTTLWKEMGLGKVINIGKFWSTPCASGNYSWLDYDNLFTCKFCELPDEELNLITFSLK